MGVDLQPTNAGLRLIKDWEQARKTAERAKEDLSRAETNEMNARIEVIRWLVPENYHQNEVYRLAVHEGFLQAKAGTIDLVWNPFPVKGL